MSQKLIAIPASLVPKFEEWGEMTARLFGELRRETGLQPTQIPEDQAWYWTKQWQQWERQADEALTQGDYEDFDDVEELIKALHAHV